MKKGFTKKGLTDWIWTISGLTNVIGAEFVTSSGEGRSVAWADDDGYWFWLKMSEEDGSITATIGDNGFGNTKIMYAAIGYCQYHNIPHEGVGEAT